jgi:aspartate aminotransferase-like enzyme
MSAQPTRDGKSHAAPRTGPCRLTAAVRAALMTAHREGATGHAPATHSHEARLVAAASRLGLPVELAAALLTDRAGDGPRTDLPS